MLKGTLDDFTLPDMFRLMSLAKKTGRMDVVRQAGTGKVFFHEGEVYYAESSLSKEPLGRKLVRSRALNESQLNKALDLHAQTGERVGSILVNSGMVTAAQIESAVQQQIEDAIFDLLRWDLGEFTWEDGAELAVEVPIGVSVENLIMEASRRLDELEVIKRKIPSAHAVLTMAPAPPEGAAEINITPDEWRVLVLVDGGRTVEDIGVMSGLDEFETMRMLYGLVSAGLIELDPDATEAAMEAAATADDAEQPEAEEPEAEQPDAEQPDAEQPEAEQPEAEQPEAEQQQPTASIEVEDAPETAVEDALETDEPEVAAEAEPGFEAESDATLEDDEVVSPMDSVLAEYGIEEHSESGVEIGQNGTGPVVDELESLLEHAAISAEPEVAADAVAVAPEYGPLGDADAEADAEAVVQGEANAAPDAPPADWFEDPADIESTSEAPAGDDPFLNDLLDDEPAAPAPPAAEIAHRPDPADVEVAEHPEPAAEAPAPPPEAPPARQAAADAPSVDRAAVVRELAGLFDDDRPRPKATPSGSPRPKPADPDDQKKRVEDDDQINKGLVSRLIKGVKGL